MASTNQMVKNGVGIVVALVVTAIMLGLVLPVGIDEMVAVDTTNWSNGAQSIWDVLDLIFILVVFLTVIGWAISSYD